MAFSALVACSRSAQLALLCMKRTSSAFLRPFFVFSFAFYLALLIPRILSFLFSVAPLLSSLLRPAPIFLLANVLIVVILISSTAAKPNTPHNPFTACFPSHTYTRYASPLYHASPSPLSYDGLTPGVLQHATQQNLMEQQQQPGRALESALSDFSKCLVPVSVESDELYDITVCASAHRTLTDTAGQLSEMFCPESYADVNMKQLAIQERPSKDLQFKAQRSVLEPAQKSLIVNTGLVRSSSDSRIRNVDNSTACEKALRRTKTADHNSVVLKASCHAKSSSMIVMDVAPIDNLMDADFHRRCDEFIANNYQNWKKESRRYRT